MHVPIRVAAVASRLGTSNTVANVISAGHRLHRAFRRHLLSDAQELHYSARNGGDTGALMVRCGGVCITVCAFPQHARREFVFSAHNLMPEQYSTLKGAHANEHKRR